MKILLATGIYPPDAGGPATYTRALARALASSGEHQVEVICYGDADHVSSEDGYRVQRIGRNRDVITRYWNFFVAVVQRAQENDVVYLQGPDAAGLPGTLGALITGKPTMMKVVGDYAWEVYAGTGGMELVDAFLTHRHSGKVWWLEMIERWTANRAKKIIVPSEYLKTVVTKWGVAADRINVIYNAVEPLPAGRSREEMRAVSNLTEKRVLFYGGRAVRWKGIPFVIHLLSELPKEIVLAIAGDGPSLSEWKMEAERAHVADRVLFLGALDRTQLGEWLRAADLFVLPSGYEGFPFCIVEAAISGLPSFVSDKGGNPETQKLLGWDHVRVLPYENRPEWLSALQGTWSAHKQVAMPIDLQMSTMIEKTVNILKSV